MDSIAPQVIVGIHSYWPIDGFSLNKGWADIFLREIWTDKPYSGPPRTLAINFFQPRPAISDGHKKNRIFNLSEGQQTLFFHLLLS